MSHNDVSTRVAKTLSNYMLSVGHTLKNLPDSSTRLMQDVGLSSDDGVMLVLDFCQDFEITLPDDFSATVHDDGRRDRTFGELVTLIGACVKSKESVK